MLERPPFVPGRRKRRRWIPAVSVVIVGLVLPTASLLDRATPRGEGGEPPVTAELATISAASYRVAVPPGLSRIAIEDADLVTFVTGLDAGYGSRLYRLWRLNLRTGGLIPGAVVASVSDLRLLPGREDLRLAFLVRGGGLFSLTGFLARRPQWLVGDVVAFDFPATRAPVAVRIDERTASRRGDLDVRVEVVRVEELRARSVDATTVRGVDVTGARVVGTSTYL